MTSLAHTGGAIVFPIIGAVAMFSILFGRSSRAVGAIRFWSDILPQSRRRLDIYRMVSIAGVGAAVALKQQLT